MNEEIKDIENMSPNEADVKLRFDAFTAGIENGGLRSVTSISMLVCYIVANIGCKVTADNIINTMNEGMIANHFEISNAISKLKKSGTIIEEEDGTLSLKQSSLDIVELIEKDLPLTIREKSIKLCQKIIAREIYKRENKVEINKLDKGYEIVLRISDKDNDFMNLKLYAPTEDQAILIQDKFIQNPIKVYDTMIEAIFNND